MAVFAYVRVSTQMQTLESQIYEIENWCQRKGWHVDKWTNESVSGTVAWEKRSLGRLIRKMKRGDTLVSAELSRLGRSMLMIMSILNYCVQKGIHIYTIKDNFELSDNINSKIIAFAFALASEIERTLISQRTREALAAKKIAGVRLGRPPGATKKVIKVHEEIHLVKARIEDGESLTHIAKTYGIHRNTLSIHLKTASSAMSQCPENLDN